jgi:thymidylate synthase (FAD)
MTELKETASNSKRKTHDDFKYGIPYEDARYILPLATTTNITVTMTADKLIDLYLLMYRYNSIFNDILKAFESEIPEDLHKLIIYIITAKYGVHKTIDFAFSDAHFAYEDYFDQLNSTNNVVPISFSGLSDVSIATLTSQNEKSPMDIFERWEYLGEDLYEKSISMINRVISYGHTAILEHHRTTFAMECSLSAYHQVIRHRLQNIHRESIYSLTTPDKLDFYVPDSINVSQFKDEYIALMEKYKKILESIDFADRHWLMIALPNARMVKFIVSSNARNDITILRDRLCLTAQTEIREMYDKKFSMLFDMYPQLYKYAVPPCVTSGKCKEGKLSCGNAEYMQDKYANVKNYKQK